MTLLPALQSPTGPTASREAVRFGALSLTYGELSAASTALAARIADAGRVAVWATPTPETVIAVVAALRAGVPAVPLNPRTGENELAHILGDSEPTAVLAGPDDELPPGLEKLRRVTVDARAAASGAPQGSEAYGAGPGVSAMVKADGAGEAGPGVYGIGEADGAGEARPAAYDIGEAGPEDPALIVYTSGTTGPPKGAVLPRRAVAASLDALEEAWGWTGDDVLVHALPLFHVHGLILGVLGPLRRGGSVRHLGKFSPRAWPVSWGPGARCSSAYRRCTTGWRRRWTGRPAPPNVTRWQGR